MDMGEGTIESVRESQSLNSKWMKTTEARLFDIVQGGLNGGIRGELRAVRFGKIPQLTRELLSNSRVNYRKAVLKNVRVTLVQDFET